MNYSVIKIELFVSPNYQFPGPAKFIQPKFVKCVNILLK